MTRSEEQNAILDELIKGETDTAKIEKLARMKTLQQEGSAEESKLLAKVGELTENYKKLILNMPVTTEAGKADGGYTPPAQVKDFSEFFKEAATKLERNK